MFWIIYILIGFVCFITMKKNRIWLYLFIIVFIGSCLYFEHKESNYKRMIKEGKQIDGLPSKYWE